MELAECRGLPDSLRGAGSSLEEASTFFEEQLEPAALAINTREGYYDCWRSFVSYAFLHDALDEVMPATPRLVKAYLWNLLQCEYKPGTVTSHIYAVIDRHRSHSAAFPFSSRAVKRFIDAFERVCSVPRKEAPAFTATQLRRLLRLPRCSLRHLRDAAIVAVGALCALRVEEVAYLDVCDALFDFDGPCTLVLRVKKHKNDQKRAGLWPRIGEARDPALDVIRLLKTWLTRAGLQPHPGCEKKAHPRSPCRACGRLFSRLQGRGDEIFPVGHAWHGITNSTVSDAVRASLQRIDVDPTGYCGKSLRVGGLTAALAASVPSDLYSLQSGHESNAWKKYVRGGQCAKLYLFAGSFGL